METPAFQFKQFKIEQNHCAFKVGTDSVLLGSWAKPADAKRILDIGTGSGVLALMMAQKSPASITAIDIDEGACLQAKANAIASPWSNRVEVAHSSLQDFEKTSGPFDLIITNPPYFTNAAHANASALSKARNTQQLSFSELAKAVFRILTDEGRFYIVLPKMEAIEFRTIAEKSGLVLTDLLRVQTKPGESFEKRHLMLFQKSAYLYTEKVLMIEDQQHHSYTDEYRELTKDFYLAF